VLNAARQVLSVVMLQNPVHDGEITWTAGVRNPGVMEFMKAAVGGLQVASEPALTQFMLLLSPMHAAPGESDVLA
jgi:hypothetical protein